MMITSMTDDDDESARECGYDKRTCVYLYLGTAATASLVITMIISTMCNIIRSSETDDNLDDVQHTTVIVKVCNS